MNINLLRKMGHKVVDVFPFFNELELLELRLKILYPYVDKFNIIECAQTFSGKSKPLYFTENQNRFEEWSDKLNVYIVNDPLLSRKDLKTRLLDEESPNDDIWILRQLNSSRLTEGAFHWKQEFYQKECARRTISDLDDQDIIFYGDLDEIWNPLIEFEWSDHQIFKLEQTVFQYWMNNRSSEKWNSAFFTAAKNIRGESLNKIRSIQNGIEIVRVPTGGWHFTFQGGANRIRYKIESYGHQEFNKRRIKSNIENQLSSNLDLFGRGLEFWVDESTLPDKVLEMKNQHPDWFL